MRSSMLIAALAGSFALPASALADEVYLRNGASIAGRVTESGDEVIVAVAGGTLRLHVREVDRIERGKLPEELYAERAAATDFSDPVDVRALATYAGKLGLSNVSHRLQATANEVELEALVGALGANDARGFREAARFARERILGRTVERYLLGRALAIDPELEEARLALAEIDREEREEAQAIAAAELELRAAEERARAERAIAAQRAEAERLRRELELERDRAERERQALERERRDREDRAIYGPVIIHVGGRGGRRCPPPPLPPPPPPPKPRIQYDHLPAGAPRP